MHTLLTTIKARFIPVVGTSIAVVLVLALLQVVWGNYKSQRYQKIAAQAIIKPTKVFQIGFSKCGTSTLAHFFSKNGVPAVHHDSGRLPSTIHQNYVNGKPLISQVYERILVFTDMELLYKEPMVNVPVQYFKELDQQYPGSKFILNTRNKTAWLKSRSKQPISPSNESLLVISAKLQNISTQELEQRWSQEWDEHHKAVLEYFKDRPNDLLVFDIEKEGPEKLVEFFKNDFRLNPDVYTAKNQTMYRKLNKFWANHFGASKMVVIVDEKIQLKPKSNPK